MNNFSLHKFAEYMKDKDVLTTSISFVIAGMMKKIIEKITNEIIKPKSLRKINFKEHLLLIVQLIFVSYFLFALDKIIGNYL